VRKLQVVVVEYLFRRRIELRNERINLARSLTMSEMRKHLKGCGGIGDANRTEAALASVFIDH
jgi:hypothetical protein